MPTTPKVLHRVGVDSRYIEGFAESCLERIGIRRVRYCTTSFLEVGTAPDFDRMLCNASGYLIATCRISSPPGLALLRGDRYKIAVRRLSTPPPFSYCSSFFSLSR